MKLTSSVTYFFLLIYHHVMWISGEWDRHIYDLRGVVLEDFVDILQAYNLNYW